MRGVVDFQHADMVARKIEQVQRSPMAAPAPN
jgi:hypothetical protein